MGFMDLNGNAFPIIRDTNLLPSDVDVDFLHFFVPLEVVGCVD